VVINANAPILARAPRHLQAIHLRQPAIRVDLLRDTRQHRQVGEGHLWRLVLAGARLVGALLMVALQKRRHRVAGLAQVGRLHPLQAFFLQGVDAHPQAEPEAHDCRGEIALLGAADQARVAVDAAACRLDPGARWCRRPREGMRPAALSTR
jgi:hypothetical protein